VKKIFFAICIMFFKTSLLNATPIVALDSGHEPSKSGATSSCLKKEYLYNDEVVAHLEAELKKYRVVRTRDAGKEVETELPGLKTLVSPSAQEGWDKGKKLFARAAIANKEGAGLLISIHHDSVPEKELVLDPKICEGKGGKRINDKFRKERKIGFNVFVFDNEKNPNAKKSIAFAKIVGEKLKALGRVPSDYHVQPFEPCNSCRAVDAALGVYNQDLAVLKNAKMPSVLIEVGNLMDPQDEQKVSSDGFRKSFAGAIAQAVDAYFALDKAKAVSKR